MSQLSGSTLPFNVWLKLSYYLSCLHNQVVKLKAFSKFENTSEALEATSLLIDGKPSKDLRKFLRAHCEGETLAVSDSKLGNAIKEKLVSFHNMMLSWIVFSFLTNASG